MIALLDNGQDLDACAAEIGCEVGQLLTPLTRYKLRDPGRPWAIDNGGFSSFTADAFLSLLKREEHHSDKCLFVTVPDIVGSARRTLEVFDHWKGRMSGCPETLRDLENRFHVTFRHHRRIAERWSKKMKRKIIRNKSE